MMVNAYPNDVDDARSRRQIPSPVPAFCHPCDGFYPHRGDFHPTPEASGPSVVSDSDSSHPLQQTPNVLYQVRDSSGSKKVQEIKMSKMFIILNLLTLPG